MTVPCHTAAAAVQQFINALACTMANMMAMPAYCKLRQSCRLETVPAHGDAGLFTWWVLQAAPGRGPASKVLAVEPMSQNVAVMQANLQQHGLANQVAHADCLHLRSCVHCWAVSFAPATCDCLLQNSGFLGIWGNHRPPLKGLDPTCTSPQSHGVAGVSSGCHANEVSS